MSSTNATRLLSAGAYLEPAYRNRVIRELLTLRYREVAPSYGYDAVTVLAHALAARRLRRLQLGTWLAGTVLLIVLAVAGVLPTGGMLLLIAWLTWAVAFLRRVATLQVLMTQLREGTGVSRPQSPALTPDLVAKIHQEQSSATDRIRYADYRPFVGAGSRLLEWSMAELLLPARLDPTVIAYLDPGGAAEQPELIPFGVGELTEYVAKRLQAELRDNPPYGEQVENLAVERRRYTRSKLIPVRRRWLVGGFAMLPTNEPVVAPRLIPDKERYDAEREYLCVRVGSWNHEVVTSMFVGFDVRGNTLYCEFNPYLLPPVIESFHLVDRLPTRLSTGVLLRVGLHSLLELPVVAFQSVGDLLQSGWNLLSRRASDIRVKVADNSEFRLSRYAALADTGAVTSVRELGAARDFHLFVQEADSVKYIKLVERRLLKIIESFLIEHNVDLAEHTARQATILDNSTNTYEANVFGSENNLNMGGHRVRQG